MVTVFLEGPRTLRQLAELATNLVYFQNAFLTNIYVIKVLDKPYLNSRKKMLIEIKNSSSFDSLNTEHLIYFKEYSNLLSITLTFLRN